MIVFGRLYPHFPHEIGCYCLSLSFTTFCVKDKEKLILLRKNNWLCLSHLWVYRYIVFWGTGFILLFLAISFIIPHFFLYILLTWSQRIKIILRDIRDVCVLFSVKELRLYNQLYRREVTLCLSTWKIICLEETGI